MLLAFGDEFGDFSPLSHNQVSYRPICGYAGILVPADAVESLERGFLELKLIVAGGNLRGKLEDIATRRSLGGAWVAKAMREAHLKRNLLMRHEIKGRDVFSQRYWTSRENDARKRRTLLRVTKLFLELLARHKVEIVFFGEHKLGRNWTEDGHSPSRRRPEVRLIKDFLNVVQAAASEDRCTCSVFMDHHPFDLPTKAYRQAQSRGEKAHLTAAHQTRMQYAREQILQNNWGLRLQGTIHSVDSEWSSFIQMADWVCTMVSNWAMYEAEPLDFSRYKALHAAVDHRLRQSATAGSVIRMPPRSALSREERLDPLSEIRPKRIYQPDLPHL